MFLSTAQDGANGRSIHLPRGKGLGGSTLINCMVLNRAPAPEYNAFEELGSKGWNWLELLKYFRKSEAFSYTAEEAEKFSMQVDVDAHGDKGPLQVTLPRWTFDMHFPFVKAFESMGVPLNPDSSNGNNIGVWTATSSIDPASVTRSSSASAYYEPNKPNSNLSVISGAHVTRILFASKRDAGRLFADGVEYVRDGTLHVVSAKKEVILCAGSYKTPQLLELSGIGDQNILHSHNIPTVIDLPGVGNNLQEHSWTSLTAQMYSQFESMDVLTNAARAAKELDFYDQEKDGMFSSVSSAYAFLPTKWLPDYVSICETAQDFNAKQAPNASPGILNALQLQTEWLKRDDIPFIEYAHVPSSIPVLDPELQAGKSFFSFFISLLHPFSRGSVHINSSDPLISPTVDPRFLDNEVDLNIMVNGVKLARKLISTDPLRAAGMAEVTPGLGVQSDADIAEYVKNTIQTAYHPVGTAAMMPREAGGVVDADLKVYGTENLRVVDASIIPIQIGGHTQATLYAVAEKAADLIKMNNGH